MCSNVWYIICDEMRNKIENYFSSANTHIPYIWMRSIPVRLIFFCHFSVDLVPSFAGCVKF